MLYKDNVNKMPRRSSQHGSADPFLDANDFVARWAIVPNILQIVDHARDETAAEPTPENGI